jgi:hypothetical protein
MRTDKEIDRWINKALAMSGLILAAGIAATALAESKPGAT